MEPVLFPPSKWSHSTITLPLLGFPGGSGPEESACNAGNSGLIPEEGNDYLLQYSCLENSMDRGAWQATVHGIAKSRTRLSYYNTSTFTLSFAEGFGNRRVKTSSVLGSSSGPDLKWRMCSALDFQGSFKWDVCNSFALTTCSTLFSLFHN